MNREELDLAYKRGRNPELDGWEILPPPYPLDPDPEHYRAPLKHVKIPGLWTYFILGIIMYAWVLPFLVLAGMTGLGRRLDTRSDRWLSNRLGGKW